MLALWGRVLMLVACVPLLQPTGFCVCKAGGRDRTLPRQVHIDAEATASSTVKKSGCCSQCHTPDAAKLLAASDLDGQPHRPCPAPDNDSHLPGCPASPGVDRFKWVEPIPQITSVLPPLDSAAFLPVEVKVSTLVSVPTSTFSPSSPPLYLSHCSLVI
jgi:hypothetical protein